MKPVICKVCNRRLNNYTDDEGASYVHPSGVMVLHEPEPIEAPPGWRGECDFCSGGEPVSVLPVDDFRLPQMSNHMSLGDWAVCGPCGVLIESEMWASLVNRLQGRRRSGARYQRTSCSWSR